jgi:hypothetical protein
LIWKKLLGRIEEEREAYGEERRESKTLSLT